MSGVEYEKVRLSPKHKAIKIIQMTLRTKMIMKMTVKNLMNLHLRINNIITKINLMNKMPNKMIAKFR